MKLVIDYSYRAFKSEARTLLPEVLGYHAENGWTIDAIVMEDYYEWINFFVATHPVYGCVEGDFEDKVTADSQEALDDFLNNFHYYEWDYNDI